VLQWPRGRFARRLFYNVIEQADYHIAAMDAPKANGAFSEAYGL
jgi:hypothetical protein